jgi:hypothetical protein
MAPQAPSYQHLWHPTGGRLLSLPTHQQKQNAPPGCCDGVAQRKFEMFKTAKTGLSLSRGGPETVTCNFSALRRQGRKGLGSG